MAMEHLLEILQDQANLTTSQLAAMLGEKEEDVVKAIKKYEKEGVIKGYHALINWERTEVPQATALIELRVSPQKDTGFDEIAGRVMNFPRWRASTSCPAAMTWPSRSRAKPCRISPCLSPSGWPPLAGCFPPPPTLC